MQGEESAEPRPSASARKKNRRAERVHILQRIIVSRMPYYLQILQELLPPVPISDVRPVHEGWNTADAQTASRGSIGDENEAGAEAGADSY